MKTLVRHSFPLAALTLIFTLIPQLSTLFAQGTAFTYQGRVTESSSPYTGSAEFQPTLWDAVSGGSAVAANNPATLIAGVTNGLFVLPLDFGGAPFAAGLERWLQLEMRTSIGAFTTLAPRQKLAPTPYAITAGNLGGTLPAGQLTGTLPSGQLGGTYLGALAFSNVGNSFSGSGAGLTALNASQLASGTVPDARLPAGVARTNQVWLLGGNAGTSVGTDFVGTTDNRPLELKVSNQRALRLEGGSLPIGAPNLIGGSPTNFIGSGVVGATIGGGGAMNYSAEAQPHSVLANFGVIGGGLHNTIEANSGSSTIGGGYDNTIQAGASSSTIAGGLRSTIGTGAHWAAIGGGERNLIEGSQWATIGGGSFNTLRTNSNYATIAGGDHNVVGIGASRATIGGGDENSIQTNASYATIGGGYANTIQPNGFYGTIPGGDRNSATNRAFAAGSRAKANHIGSFVWADWGGVVDFASTAPNQFLIRAIGNVGINKNNPATALDVNGTVTATGFSGSGAGLTSLMASQLTTGTLPDARLGSDVARRSGGNDFTGQQTVTSGSVGIGAAPQDALLDIEGNARLNNYDLFLRHGTDRNHGLGWYGSNYVAKGFAGVDVDGPVLYGWSGGVLGSTVGGSKVALHWTADARVGVGTANPATSLHVASPSGPASALIGQHHQSGGYAALLLGVGAISNSYAYVQGIRAAGSSYGDLALNPSGGSVGIGTTVPLVKFHVRGGRIRMEDWYSDGSIAVYRNANGDLAAQNSDRRLKENITPITNALAAVRGLTGVTFNWRSDPEGAGKTVGLIAQDVQAVLPELTFECQDEDGETYLGVHYEKVAAVLANAINELNDGFEAKLEAELKQKEGEIAELRQAITDLKQVVRELARLNGGAP